MSLDVKQKCWGFVDKSDVKKAIFNHHYDAMKEEMSSMSKLEPVQNEDFRDLQSYFDEKSIENGRMAFKICCQMVDNIPDNFKNKYKNKKHELICSHCTNNDQVMTQIHCLECSHWTDIRKDLDLSKIDDLVTFFQRLLAERTKEEKRGLNMTGPHCTTPTSGEDSGSG